MRGHSFVIAALRRTWGVVRRTDRPDHGAAEFVTLFAAELALCAAASCDRPAAPWLAGFEKGSRGTGGLRGRGSALWEGGKGMCSWALRVGRDGDPRDRRRGGKKVYMYAPCPRRWGGGIRELPYPLLLPSSSLPAPSFTGPYKPFRLTVAWLDCT